MKKSPKPNHPPLLEKLTGAAAKKHGSIPKVQLPGDNHYQKDFNNTLSACLQNNSLFRRSILPVIPSDGRLVTMTSDHFVSWVTNYCAPYRIRYDKDGDPIEIFKDMTQTHSKQALTSHEFIFSMPPIERIYPCPVPLIDPNSFLTLATPGYNPSTATYVFDSDIDQHYDPPTEKSNLISSDGYYDDRRTLSESVKHLYSVLKNFPFSDWEAEFYPTEDHPLYQLNAEGIAQPTRLSRSLSVQIGAMLSIFAANCVPQLASRMGFIMMADQQRSGKTLLVKIATIPVYGTFHAQSWREDEESMIKLLDAEVLHAAPYICFDNVRSLVQSQSLEGFMTAPSWTGRILGASEIFSAENNATVFLTGNNLNLGTDIQHRCLIIDLHVPEADIQSRDIENIIDDYWLADPTNRRDILNALWSIVRHWDAAGRPLATGRTRHGFDRWGKIIGGMVEFAGLGDMLATPILENAGDTETEDIRTIVTILYELGAHDYTHAEVIHHLWINGLLVWNMSGREEYRALREGGGDVMTLNIDSKSHSRMGTLLQRHCHGERGSYHTINVDKVTTKVKFYSKGKGRHRRYFIHKLSQN